MKDRTRNTSKSRSRELKLRDFIAVLLKYIPEDRVRVILKELDLLSEEVEKIIEDIKGKIPKPTPLTLRDPAAQREYERLYLSLTSLREYVSALDRRVSALERAMERVLEQLSSLEISKAGD